MLGARCWVAPPVGRNVVMRVTGGAEALCGHIISDHHIIIMGRCQNRRKAGQHCSKISISTGCVLIREFTAQGSSYSFGIRLTLFACVPGSKGGPGNDKECAKKNLS